MPGMPVSDQTLSEARSYRSRAIEALLAEHFPRVQRMAYGLSGREDVGRGIVRFVMTRAAHNLPRWRDPDAAERWFYHHTVLTQRRSTKHEPDPRGDLLLTMDPQPDAAYAAFVRAIRSLPVQQREAYILSHGEHWNVRLVAIAMDCSTSATDVHLKGAEQELSAVAGAAYPQFVQRFVNAYQRLTPTPESGGSAVSSYATRIVAPRRAKRWLMLFVLVALLAAAAWLGRDLLRSYLP